MKKKKWSLDEIPKVKSPARRQLIGFTAQEFYQKEIESGIPFYSEGELEEIGEKYSDKGITKNDLMREIYKKGWQIKENTIKSYIQKGLIPRAIKREKTDKGMISIYPSDTIRHLNFTRYCLFSRTIEALSSLLKNVLYDDLTILRDASVEISSSDLDPDHCLVDVWAGIMRIEEEGLPWTEESINYAFSKQEDKKNRYLKKLNEIKGVTSQLSEKVAEFTELLKGNQTPLDEIHLDLYSTPIFGK